MSGYSGTPLHKKLGIGAEMKIMLYNPPENYGELVEYDIAPQIVQNASLADFVHLFVTTRKELDKEFSAIISSAKNDLVIWVSWYKKSAGIATDITENVIREIVLPKGWVDIKVCAVDDKWSGLKIVKRKIK